MDARLCESAEAIRARVERGEHERASFRESFRAALAAVPPIDRDAWADVALGIDELPEDGPALPQGGVPYLPCSVDALLRIVDTVPLGPTEVFVDIGAGVGRAAALVHLLTGAPALGIEVQPALVEAARALARRLRLGNLAFVEGDAAELPGALERGSVFFLYCPFGGARLERVLAHLEPIARRRAIWIACVDLALPPREWLAPVVTARDVTIHRSA